MRVLDSSSAELTAEFGIAAGRWERYAGLGSMPFGAMWCRVPPGGRSNPDCHEDRELVVIVQGSLEVQAGGASQVASAGSAVLLDSGEEHVLVNLSSKDPVLMLSLYWLPGPQQVTQDAS